MSHEATFDPALLDEKDWVRQLIGDTDVTRAKLSDAQVVGFITEVTTNNGAGPWVKYLAASLAGQTVIAKWQADGNGVVEKAVGTLRIRRNGGDSAETSYTKHLKTLRSKGNELLLKAQSSVGKASSVFRVL